MRRVCNQKRKVRELAETDVADPSLGFQREKPIA